MVRAYLLENPEVIIEALEIHQARQEELQAATARANLVQLHGTLTGDQRDPVMGNPDGDVTIGEFFDYQCGFCKRVAKELFEVVEDDGNVRLVLKEFPFSGQPTPSPPRPRWPPAGKVSRPCTRPCWPTRTPVVKRGQRDRRRGRRRLGAP